MSIAVSNAGAAQLLGDKGCTARTRGGQPCGMPALHGRDLCFNHDPLSSRKRVAARKLGGQNRRSASDVGERDTEKAHKTAAQRKAVPKLRNATDVLREAESLLAETKTLLNSARRTTAVVGVLSLALKGIEAGDFEQRLETLERLFERQRAQR